MSAPLKAVNNVAIPVEVDAEDGSVPIPPDQNATRLTGAEKAMAAMGGLPPVPPHVVSSSSSTGSSSRPTIKYLLHALLKHGASDLHLRANRPPMYRINGKLVAAKMSELSATVVKDVLYSILNPKLVRTFEDELQVDCSFLIEGMGRFRANIYVQRGTVAGVIRMIPLTIPTLESLALPTVLKELSLKKRGLVLITGSTGCGKSTTMAALINHINEHRHSHVVTIEDPIEFVYRDSKSSISQREVGTDITTMYQGLMAALRQDPDVISIGEMRQPETIETALTAAETGHLVVSTLHTNDAKSTIDRIIDVFPPGSKNQVRIQLSACLLAIVSQKLVPRADGEGRVAVCEIMIKSPTIENLILKNEIDKIEEAMQASTTYYKMQTFNQALERMVMAGTITNEDAIFASNSPDELKMRLSGFKKEEGY